jgi:hypothetical protein
MKKINFKAWIPVICLLITVSWISTPLFSLEKDATVMNLRQLMKTLSPSQRAQFNQAVKAEFQCSKSEDQADPFTRMENIFKNFELILTPEQLTLYRSISMRPQQAKKVITPFIQTCNECYWSNWALSHGITALEAARNAYDSDYCTSPPYGLPNPVLGSIDFALSYADDALTNFTTAQNSCNCTAAQQGLEDLLDAIQFTEGAIDITNIYCTSNSPWMSDLTSALNFLNAALAAAQDCIDAACGASS